MLHTLHIKNFTVFSDAQFQFSPGLNVIIGDNGTGKSHLLYLAYSIESVRHQAWQHYLHTAKNKDKESWQRDLATKLKQVFCPEKLGRLCRYKQKQRTEIQMVPSLFGQPVPQGLTAFSFSVTAKEKVKLEQTPGFGDQPPPNSSLESLKNIPLPLFFPLKEVLSFYPGFMKSYEQREWAFETLYYDLCQALTAIPFKGKHAEPVAKLVAPLEEILQGELVLYFNRFYLQHQKYGQMEIPLIPEGLRKIAILSYLLKNGSLATGSTLFWDEPEVGLNARLMVKLADSLEALVKAGVQVILTTHDLFLMKELSLRAIASQMPTYFFSLATSELGLEVEQGEELDDLSHIVALDTELAQWDRGQDAQSGPSENMR